MFSNSLIFNLPCRPLPCNLEPSFPLLTLLFVKWYKNPRGPKITLQLRNLSFSTTLPLTLQPALFSQLSQTCPFRCLLPAPHLTASWSRNYSFSHIRRVSQSFGVSYCSTQPALHSTLISTLPSFISLTFQYCIWSESFFLPTPPFTAPCSPNYPISRL